MNNEFESKERRTANEMRQTAPGAAVQGQPKSAKGRTKGAQGRSKGAHGQSKSAQGQPKSTQSQPMNVLGLRLDAEEARKAIVLSEIISAPLAKRRRRR